MNSGENSSDDDQQEEEDHRGGETPSADEDVETILEKVKKVADSAVCNVLYYVDYDSTVFEFNKFKKALLFELPENLHHLKIIHLKQFETEEVDKFIEKTLGDIKFYPALFCGCHAGVFRLEGNLSRQVYNIQRLIFIE